MNSPRCEMQNSPEFPNAVEIETANATYRLVYGDHFIDQDHEILRGADAIVAEIAAGNSEEQARDDYNMNVSYMPQFSSVLRHAKKEGVPIYFVDTEHAFELPYFAKMVIEGLMACGLLNYFVRGKNLDKILTRITNRKEEGVTSRRHFLRSALRAMGLAGATYLLSTPAIINLAVSDEQNPNESDMSRKLSRLLLEANNAIHPELGRKLTKGRDHLMAHKAEKIAKQLARENGEKPTLTILVGLAHFGMEKSLCMTTEERSKILADIFEEEELSQETIVKLDFKKNEISFLGMNN